MKKINLKPGSYVKCSEQIFDHLLNACWDNKVSVKDHLYVREKECLFVDPNGDIDNCRASWWIENVGEEVSVGDFLTAIFAPARPQSLKFTVSSCEYPDIETIEYNSMREVLDYIKDVELPSDYTELQIEFFTGSVGTELISTALGEKYKFDNTLGNTVQYYKGWVIKPFGAFQIRLNPDCDRSYLTGDKPLRGFPLSSASALVYINKKPSFYIRPKLVD